MHILGSFVKLIFLTSVAILNTACYSGTALSHYSSKGDGLTNDTNAKRDFRRNEDGILKIGTLNVAHGRKDSINQMLLSRQSIRNNLLEVAAVIVREDIDVVALQEADGPSVWSGNFDHVELIARQAGYPWYFRADHATSPLFTYGTAILSRWPISETLEHTFKPSPPTLNKGFLLGRITWLPTPNAEKERHIDIVSVHLDFSRKYVREQQIMEIAETLSRRDNPRIILGDFNSEWLSDRSVVKRLAANARMKAFQPHADQYMTYLKRDARLDWILISNDLEFVSYQVLPDLVSDHLAVVAEVKLID
jgi:endonuclease/exonuclease/phosphatase family metal-dependent hydrolase